MNNKIESVAGVLGEIAEYCEDVLLKKIKKDTSWFSTMAEASRLKAACEKCEASEALSLMRFLRGEPNPAKYIERLELAMGAESAGNGRKSIAAMPEREPDQPGTDIALTAELGEIVSEMLNTADARGDKDNGARSTLHGFAREVQRTARRKHAEGHAEWKSTISAAKHFCDGRNIDLSKYLRKFADDPDAIALLGKFDKIIKADATLPDARSGVTAEVAFGESKVPDDTAEMGDLVPQMDVGVLDDPDDAPERADVEILYPVPVEPSGLPCQSALSPQEKSRLNAIEGRLMEIAKSVSDNYLEFARSLREIQEQRLFRGEYCNFREYCDKKLGITYRRAKQLIDSLSVREELEKVNTCSLSNLPNNEAQLRMLAVLDDPVRRLQAWNKAREMTPPENQPTGAMVRKAVSSIKENVAGGAGGGSGAPNDSKTLVGAQVPDSRTGGKKKSKEEKTPLEKEKHKHNSPSTDDGRENTENPGPVEPEELVAVSAEILEFLVGHLPGKHVDGLKELLAGCGIKARRIIECAIAGAA